jgi:hypothetical protein
MYSDSEETLTERTRRKELGIRTLYWFKCHGCGYERLVSQGVGNSASCGNPACVNPDLHIHSDIDGEKPNTLPRHTGACGNQNAARPEGVYEGVEECGCNRK